MKIIPVILAGGFGTRLWPLSRQSLPKQFSNFFGEKTLFQNTILRFTDSERFTPPIVIGNHEHRFLIAQQLHEINIKPLAIILEPVSKNTAGSIIASSQYIQKNFGNEAISLICPADHHIDNFVNFSSLISKIDADFFQQYILTFGVKPNQPETGYGYISKSTVINAKNNIFNVEKFIEKPNINDATNLIKNPNNYWNSGIYLFNINYFLNIAKLLTPDIYSCCDLAVSNSVKDLDFTRLDDNHYNNCQNISIDFAIMEKTSNMAIMPLNLEWSDLGSWQAIRKLSPKDLQNNYSVGKVVNHNTTNCYIRSDYPVVATLGLDNLIIIATKDAILIANIDNSHQMKELYNKLQNQFLEICQNYSKALRPWGSFEIIDLGQKFKVKKILVNPFSSLSLQKHRHRAEHWVVVRGVANITCEEKNFSLQENQSTFIPRGKAHRLENKTSNILEIIEIQSGEYLGEDDIERISDNYGR
jgi:mannose-1-phosphate guanylyltransferase/mannose-6-phosphate isomerase